MKTLRAIWDFFNGKKTTISMVALLAVNGLTAFFPGVLTPEQAEVIKDAALLLGGVGVLHTAAKSDKINQAIKKATNK